MSLPMTKPDTARLMGRPSESPTLSPRPLSSLAVGQRAVVTHVGAVCSELRNRLLSMGLVPETEVSVEHVAPLGDPIGVAVRGFTLCLRKNEAASIEVATR